MTEATANTHMTSPEGDGSVFGVEIQKMNGANHAAIRGQGFTLNIRVPGDQDVAAGIQCHAEEEEDRAAMILRSARRARAGVAWLRRQAGEPEQNHLAQALDSRIVQLINAGMPATHAIEDGDDGFDADEDYHYRTGFRDALESLSLALQCSGVSCETICAAAQVALEAEANNR